MRIDELAASIGIDEADLKAVMEICAKEVAYFALEEKELTDRIDTLNRAVAIISREMQKGGETISAAVQREVLGQRSQCHGGRFGAKYGRCLEVDIISARLATDRRF